MLKRDALYQKSRKLALALSGAILLAFAVTPASAACPAVTYAALTSALQAAVAAGNGGLGFNMWATIVDRDGTVCLVARSGAAGTEWPGSRAISAQKANTANAFSLPTFALSTANLFSATQPGGICLACRRATPSIRQLPIWGHQQIGVRLRTPSLARGSGASMSSVGGSPFTMEAFLAG